MTAAARSQASPEAEPTPRNEVILWGRLPATAEERVLPSGDSISVLRVVIPRRPGTGRTGADRSPRQMVDTIDVVCWSARTRRTAQRLNPGDWIEVEGALRRRFFGGPGGRQSRYEVEAAVLRRLVRGGPRAT
jgi:single-strand DNA-binding protein